MRTPRTWLLCLLLPVAIVTAVAQEDSQQTQEVDLRLLGSSPAASGSDPLSLGFEPRILMGGQQLGAYENVYPGIASAGYGDRHHFEYAFRLEAGADPELIELALEGFRVVTMSTAQDIVHEGSGIDAYQQHPVAFRQREGMQTTIPVDYIVRGGNVVGLMVRDPSQTQKMQLNDHKLNIVPKEGQPGGPRHDFYLSKYEVTNDQFLRFLNDAQAATNNVRGTNLFFDVKGNVWFNPDMRRNRHEVFRLSQSRIIYDAGRHVGKRYRHFLEEDGSTPFSRHPVTGTSWVGAVKYCNWMTIYAGRGEAEQCYGEGTKILDWAPVTATNWADGEFTIAERELWLSFKGFRLPMLDCDPTAIHTNTYNEFYKVAAWHNAETNLAYGFGRDTFTGVEANSIETLNRHSAETMAVGFFDGENELDEIRTRRNANTYGVHDLSGNVSEWMTDFGRPRSTATRALCGGSWAHRLKAITVGEIASPVATSSFAGFRICTTFMPEEHTYIHLTYCFHMMEGPEIFDKDDTDPDERPMDPEDTPERTGFFVNVPEDEIPGVLYVPYTPRVIKIREASPGGDDDDDDDDDDDQGEDEQN